MRSAFVLGLPVANRSLPLVGKTQAEQLRGLVVAAGGTVGAYGGFSTTWWRLGVAVLRLHEGPAWGGP